MLHYFFRQKHAPFSERIVTGEEKWVCHVNVFRRREWLNPDEAPPLDVKPELHPKKIILCILWDIRVVIYFELLDMNQTVTASVYSQQLQRFNEVLLQKRPALAKQKDVILLHENSQISCGGVDSTKNRKVRMGTSSTSVVITRSCTARLSSVIVSSKRSVQ